MWRLVYIMGPVRIIQGRKTKLWCMDHLQAYIWRICWGGERGTYRRFVHVQRMPFNRPLLCVLTLYSPDRACGGPISHPVVSSGRVEFGKRLVIGTAPIAIALISDTHPVSACTEGV